MKWRDVRRQMRKQREPERPARSRVESLRRHQRDARGPSRQHEAVKAARAAAPAELLALPAPPSEPQIQQENDADGLHFETSSSDDLFDGHSNILGKMSDDSGLDQLLVSLKKDKQSDKGKASGVGAPDVDNDLLAFLDADNSDDGDHVPCFKVSKPHGGDGDGDDSPVYTPTSADDSDGDKASGLDRKGSSDSDDNAKNVPSAAAPASKHSRLPRIPATLDRSTEQPAGCICRQYYPAGAPPYWYGVLPEGVTDTKGRHTRRRAFKPGLRTKAEALAEVETWLHVHGEGSLETEDTSDDDSTPSSSSSSS